MQGIPENFVPDEYPAYLTQETDTATPRTPVPIYYFHDGNTPFCSNPHCFCQRGKRAAAILFPQLMTGKIALDQVKAGTEKIIVQLQPGIPDQCQLYGHTWEITEHPGVKQCQVCHIFGYCPGCTPIAPTRAQPFLCSHHAGRQG